MRAHRVWKDCAFFQKRYKYDGESKTDFNQMSHRCGPPTVLNDRPTRARQETGSVGEGGTWRSSRKVWKIASSWCQSFNFRIKYTFNARAKQRNQRWSQPKHDRHEVGQTTAPRNWPSMDSIIYGTLPNSESWWDWKKSRSLPKKFNIEIGVAKHLDSVCRLFKAGHIDKRDVENADETRFIISVDNEHPRIPCMCVSKICRRLP